MELILDLPKPYHRNGPNDYEYEPSDYYQEMDIQVHEFFKAVLREQFYKWKDLQFRQDLMTYMRRHGMNELYLEVREDLYNG